MHRRLSGTLRAVIRKHAPRIVLLLLVVAAAIWLFGSGAYRDVDVDAYRDRLRAAGAWGAIAFVLLFAFVQPLGPSGHVFVIGASLVWSSPLAFALSLLGATWGQINAFFFYRYIAHDWAQARIPARIRPYERALIERPLRSVLLLRLLTFTWTVAPALLGVSRVRFSPMVTATVLGLMPGIALDVWVGESLFEWLRSRWS